MRVTVSMSSTSTFYDEKIQGKSIPMNMNIPIIFTKRPPAATIRTIFGFEISNKVTSYRWESKPTGSINLEMASSMI